MKILGIDPGLNITGYAVVENKGTSFKILEAGFIQTTSKEKIEKRLDKIYKSLSDLIKTLRPDALVLEKLYAHYRHPVTACLLGHVRGVICLLSAVENIPFFEYGSTRIKKSVVGKGHASKAQMQRMVEHILHLKQPIQEDVADALAIAMAHINISERNL
ncbi:MAG: crossover junction endodeoxyribonuclease RuvC [Candidatus Omnitrophica bacterium]|nr:crossover junction endodeoxyribonuclease RuvC [Candidatus Omnitrophota bacterium]